MIKIIVLTVAVIIGISWYKAASKKAGKSKGSADVHKENNNQGDQAY